jgi:hypothetical protein
MYPASEKYALDYVYLWYAKKIKWNPGLGGIFRQDGKWGLTFGIMATEKEFRDLAYNDQLKQLYDRMERIKNMVSADQKTFAGILPGLMTSRGILNGHPSVERKTTVATVQLAIEQVIKTRGLPDDAPVLVLGGGGFIGTGLSGNNGNNRFCYVDLADQEKFLRFKESYQGQPVIVLNLTKKGGLTEYVPHFWPGVIFINEVYPEPSKAEVEALKSKGAVCYHIAGIKAKAWPAFPRGYQGGIPCCASFLPEKLGDGAFEVIVREMV